jgi:hypothetical protein
MTKADMKAVWEDSIRDLRALMKVAAALLITVLLVVGAGWAFWRMGFFSPW